jgi:hypothetical protein
MVIIMATVMVTTADIARGIGQGIMQVSGMLTTGQHHIQTEPCPPIMLIPTGPRGSGKQGIINIIQERATGWQAPTVRNPLLGQPIPPTMCILTEMGMYTEMTGITGTG